MARGESTNPMRGVRSRDAGRGLREGPSKASNSRKALNSERQSVELVSLYKNPIPEGVTTGRVEVDKRVFLRYARWAPTTDYVRGTVVLVQGRSEFIEKFFETVSDLRRRGFWVATFDWRGQGGSSRDVRNPNKGHIWDFGQYDNDLHRFMQQVVFPDCPGPFYALGHSMGAHNLIRHAGMGLCQFDRMVLSAPMLRLSREVLGFPQEFVSIAVTLASWFGLGESYVFGGNNQNINQKAFKSNKLTRDQERYERNRAILKANPALNIGSPSYAWLLAALRSTSMVMQPTFAANIKIPILLISAGSDRIVSNIATREFADRLKNGSNIIIPNARHEILQESDSVREQFWAGFDAFVPGESLLKPTEDLTRLAG